MQAQKTAIFTIFLTVFLDMLGVGLVIPVIAPLLLEPKYLLLAADSSLELRHIVLGLLLATFPLAQLFGAPILGVWADRIGRKRVLLLSLVGTLAGNLLFGYGVVHLWLWLLFFSQVLDGFTGGNISIAMSAIADVSSEEDKPRNFGLIGMAFGLGFIIGPFVGGQLAAHFDSAMPFWVCAALNALNLIFAQLYFPETYTPTGAAKKISLWAGIDNLVKIRQFPQLQIILLVVFLSNFGFSFFTQFFQVFLIDKFHFGQDQIGILFAYIGVWLVVAQGSLVRPLSRRFAPKSIVQWCLLGLGLTFIGLLLPNTSGWLWLIMPFIAIFNGVSSPNTTAIVSSMTDKDAQGEIMGIKQSAQALAQALPPLIAGFIVAFSQNLPILVAAIVTLAAGFVVLFWFKPAR